MAKQRANRSGGRGAGRRTPARGSGSTVASLALIAAVLGGGTYLYRHTAPGAVGSAPVPDATAASEPAHPVAPPPRVPAAQARPSGSTQLETSTATSLPATPPAAPFGTTEEVFENGARLYAANCAGCHGRPGRNAKGPAAAQFWERENAAGVRAVAQPVGSIYEATAKGNLVAGMPSYGQRLTDTQLWDLALLLKSAHDDLPEPVLHLLRAGQ